MSINNAIKAFEEVPEVPTEVIYDDIITNGDIQEPETVEKRSARNTLIKAIKYLNKHFEFRRNLINGDIEFRRLEKSDFNYFDSIDFRDIFLEVRIEGNVNISEQDFKNIVGSRRIGFDFNPFKEYLFGLPKWDGITDYMGMYLEQLVLKDESERNMVIKWFKKWFVALTMSLIEDRVHPFYVNQMCLVLVGSQGLYKTTWLSNLLPEDMIMRYFYESGFDPHNKDHEKYLGFKILINFDEMSSFNKTDIESIKRIITQPKVAVRLPYDRTDTFMKRHASFCGTHNNKEFLKDDSGTRRFIPIEIKAINFNNKITIDQVYAQALAMYNNKYQYWFDAKEQAELEYHNKAYSFASMEEELFCSTYTLPNGEDIAMKRVDYYTASELAIIIAKNSEYMNVNNTVIKNLGIILSKLGYLQKIRRNANGNPRKYWVVKKLENNLTYDVEENIPEPLNDLI